MTLLPRMQASSPACKLELALACISEGGEYSCAMDGMRKLGRIIIFCSLDDIFLYDLRVRAGISDYDSLCGM